MEDNTNKQYTSTLWFLGSVIFILLFLLIACSSNQLSSATISASRADSAEIRRIANPYALDVAVWQIFNLLRPVNNAEVSISGMETGTLNNRITGALTSDGFKEPFYIYYRLEMPPYLLVISPREKIAYLDRMLIRQDISIAEVETLEMNILETGSSALVVELGGLAAAYPAIISPELDKKQLIHAIVEEWAHQHLAFRPLGFLYLADSLGVRQDPDVITMNETLAGMIADEITQKIYRQYYYNESRVSNAPADTAFKFDVEMMETRIEVDRLLGIGKIDEAERYMEQRRLVFNQRGYKIRKLNQAYFAFHGIYGQDPVSVSPVYRDMQKLRDKYTLLADFEREVSAMTGYGQLRAVVR